MWVQRKAAYEKKSTDAVRPFSYVIFLLTSALHWSQDSVWVTECYRLYGVHPSLRLTHGVLHLCGSTVYRYMNGKVPFRSMIAKAITHFLLLQYSPH